MADNKDRLKSYNNRLESLRTERSTFMNYWGELSDNILFTRGKFLTTDRKAPKRNTRQYNNTPRMAARTQASGMMAGITSPARPWFKLTTSDPMLSERRAVKDWMHTVQTIMYTVFGRSNTYNCLHTLYSDLGTFATSAMGVYENYDSVIRCRNYSIGSYMIATDPDDEVNTFYFEGVKTVAQLVKQFGIENVSQNVKNMWERGNAETMIEYVHIIEPNDNRNMLSPLARDMAYRSCYFEKGNGKMNNTLLQSGFMTFPILAPRWDVSADSAYGDDCPGMLCLGDSKALQLGEKRKYQALDKLVNPPLQGDADTIAKIKNGTLQPGDMVPVSIGKRELSSVYGNYTPRLDYIQSIQQEVEMRIKRAYYEDLFLMLANTDRRQITAREVAEKHEEKLLMLGPVLERLHSELLDKLIDRTFDVLQRNGVLPPPPPELANKELNVEYVSVMAQAQRMVGISGLERTIGFVANVSSIWPEARNKVDVMQAVDEYANATGINPRVIRPDDEAMEISQAQAAAAQQAQQQAQLAQSASTMKDISQSKVDDDNALGNMLKNAGLQ